MATMMFSKWFLFFIIATGIVLWSYSLYGMYFFNKLCAVMVCAGLIIAASNVLEFFSSDFRQFLLSFIDVTGNSSYDTSFRTHGFASGGGASLSIGILVLSFVAYLKFVNSTRSLQKIFYYCAFIFIYISNLVIGRTGLFLGMPVFIYLVFFRNLQLKNIFKRFIIIGLLVSISLYLISLIDERLMNVIYKYGLEPIYRYRELGTFESKTTSHVITMYWWPNWVHIITGAGFWRWPTCGYDLPDPGYMKLLMSTGLFGFIIFYSYQMVIYYEAFKYYVNGYGLKLLFAFLFSVLFFAELKEAVFVQNYGFKILSLFIVNSWLGVYKKSWIS